MTDASLGDGRLMSSRASRTAAMMDALQFDFQQVQRLAAAQNILQRDRARGAKSLTCEYRENLQRFENAPAESFQSRVN
jgi:hypothetical protein